MQGIKVVTVLQFHLNVNFLRSVQDRLPGCVTRAVAWGSISRRGLRA